MYIDMYAHLTGTGNGDFSKTVLEKGLLPTPEQDLANHSLDMNFLPAEFRQMPGLLRLNAELNEIALMLARVARKQKALARDPSERTNEIDMYQKQPMLDMHKHLVEFRRVWFQFLEVTTPMENWFAGLAQLPSGVFTYMIHVSFP